MIRVVARKLAHLIPVLFLVTVATFFLIELVPGDAAVTIAGPNATEQAVEDIRQDLGLDQPVGQRYVDWLGDTLTGDFGNSFTANRQAVSDILAQRLPITLELALIAMVFAFCIAVPAALVSAARPKAPPDRLLTGGAFAVISTPSFLIGLLLIFFLIFERTAARVMISGVEAIGLAYAILRIRSHAARYPPGPHRTSFLVRSSALIAGAVVILVGFIVFLPSFPRTGFSRITEDGLVANARSIFLPALTIALLEAAAFTRVLRADLISTLQEDYILSARAKGMPPWRILVRDALRPSSFSLITIAGVSLGRLLGGTIIVEQIFGIAGLGTLMIQSVQNKDIPVVQTTVLLLATFYVVINAVIDVAYGYLDPRVRRGRA